MTRRCPATWGLVLGLLAFLAGCTLGTPFHSLPGRPPLAGGHPGRILILRSADNSLQDATENVFAQQVDLDLVRRAPVLGATPRHVVKLIAETRANLVLALGTASARLAIEASTSVPVLFALVPNQAKSLPGTRRPNVAGISFEVSPLSDFLKFKLVAPQAKRFLVFHSVVSTDYLEQVRDELEGWGVELKLVPVQSVGQIRNRFADAVKGVEGVWMHSDPVVMNAEAFELLSSGCVAARVPLFASVSEAFARAGALASVGVDLQAMGSQAATLARRILEGGEDPAELGVVPPVGGQLTVNTGTAEAIGLALPMTAQSATFVSSETSSPDPRP